MTPHTNLDRRRRRREYLDGYCGTRPRWPAMVMRAVPVEWVGVNWTRSFTTRASRVHVVAVVSSA